MTHIAAVPDIAAEPAVAAPEATIDEPIRRGRHAILQHFKERPLALVSAGFIVVLVFIAVFAPLVSPYGVTESDLTQVLKAPSGEHLLGTDEVGRDILTRIFFGARTSLLAGLLATGVAAIVGVPLGLIAGYRGRWADIAFSRMSDSLMSVPPLILALAVVAVLGPGLTNAMFAIGIISTPRFFRVIRAAAIDVRGSTFVEASKALGCSEKRIVFAHIFPNVLSPLLVAVSVSFATAIVAEASLSFLGLGAVPPTASWGQILSKATQTMSAKHLLYAPGVTILLTVIAFTIVGDTIRDAIGMRREEDRG